MSELGFNSTVVVFSTGFPFDAIGEVTFIRPELPHLARHFERVVIAPAVEGQVQCRLPAGELEVEHGFARAIHPQVWSDRLRFLSRAVTSPWFLDELRRCPSLLANVRALRRFAYCTEAARRIGSWLVDQFRTGRWDPSSTVCYSFWLNHVVAGIGRARMAVPDLKVISRAHGADIYEQRYVPQCLPLHHRAVAAVDRVFVASRAGLDHLAQRYPTEAPKMSVAPLGSPEPGFLASPSGDGTFRVVSCSSLEKVKRVDLLVRSLAVLGGQMPGQKLGWCHLGDGTERHRIETLCRDVLPSNVAWNLRGRLSPEDVMAHYREHPVDLFISTTASEGGRPVSMAEALSCGIPVAATAVGGVPEIVSEEHGWLMPPDPTAGEVAVCVRRVVDGNDLSAFRDAARRYWDQHLRAEVLSEEFARSLRALV